MVSLLTALLRTREHRHHRRFEDATANPERAQEQLLASLLRRNADTRFGQDHRFGSIRTPAEYADRVPVRDYEALRPYIDRIVAGEPAVLTDQPVTMFATTSGTTAEPKLIPVTDQWREEMAALNRLWLYRALDDHPRFLHDRLLFIVSRAVEGRTPRGVPFGALSGVTYQRIPRVVRRNYAIPYEVADLGDPDVRYLVTMRLALAGSVSSIGTPNATTLLRLAEVAADQSDVIIRAVHDGTLGVDVQGADSPTLKALASRLRPDVNRARALEHSLNQHGRLLPKACWPQLELIGCWLGGSVGRHAERLVPFYGDAARRDLGLLASEGRLTIPVDDDTAAGPLAVLTTYFEFISEERIDDSQASTVGAHELELGRRYYLVLTGGNGLYRYDLNDVVEVTGFHHATPKVGFVRKGRDMVSLTGEKVHLNHLHAAIATASDRTSLPVVEFRLIPGEDALAYDLLVEFDAPTPPQPALVAFVAAFDDALAAVNTEFQAKRHSGRLRPPVLHLMTRGWSEALARAEFREGRRDAQHKWQSLGVAWDDASRRSALGRATRE